MSETWSGLRAGGGSRGGIRTVEASYRAEARQTVTSRHRSDRCWTVLCGVDWASNGLKFAVNKCLKFISYESCLFLHVRELGDPTQYMRYRPIDDIVSKARLNVGQNTLLTHWDCRITDRLDANCEYNGDSLQNKCRPYHGRYRRKLSSAIAETANISLMRCGNNMQYRWTQRSARPTPMDR